MFKIFLVEDDIGIGEAITKQAKAWDLEVRLVEDFHNVINEFVSYDPHLVLLDISLPYFDGYYWCNEIRKVSKVPIIFISSANSNMDIIMAMNMGGDDFVTKPFDFGVLVAKMQALLRRTYNFSNSNSVYEHKGAILNTNDDTLLYNGEKIELSKNEYRILLCLLQNIGKVVSREKLMDNLWQTDTFIDENTLTVNINRLRKKLESYGLKDFITTKFGVGYIIE